MKPEQPDGVLAKKALGGNPKAFSALIRRHQDYLYRVAYQQCHNEQDALDLVQESILKAYRSLRTLRDPQLFKTWITRIVINAAYDSFRKKKPELPLADAERLPTAETLSPEDKMDLYQALERLPAKYQSLVVMKYFEDRTIREIAAATKMPEGTVSVYLSRALKELKKDLYQERKEHPLCGKI